MERFHATNAKNQETSSSNLFGVFFIKQGKNQDIRPVSYIKELSLCITTYESPKGSVIS